MQICSAVSASPTPIFHLIPLVSHFQNFLNPLNCGLKEDQTAAESNANFGDCRVNCANIISSTSQLTSW